MLPGHKMRQLDTYKQTGRENVHSMKEKSMRNQIIFECDMYSMSVVLCPVLQNLNNVVSELVRKFQSDVRSQGVKRCPENILKIIKLSE